jgi:hypothetical protein
VLEIFGTLLMLGSEPFDAEDVDENLNGCGGAIVGSQSK